MLAQKMKFYLVYKIVSPSHSMVCMKSLDFVKAFCVCVTLSTWTMLPSSHLKSTSCVET